MRSYARALSPGRRHPTPTSYPAALNTHPLRCCLAGRRQPRYHVFGPALQAAEVHEQAGLAGTAHADCTFATALRATPGLSPPAMDGALAAPLGWRAARSGKAYGGSGMGGGGGVGGGGGDGGGSGGGGSGGVGGGNSNGDPGWASIPRVGAAEPASLDGGLPLTQLAAVERAARLRGGSMVLTPWAVEEGDVICGGAER